MAAPGEEAPTKVRFIDLCAGLGGFHLATRLAELASAEPGFRGASARKFTFECVMAAELDSELREIYVQNFGDELARSYSGWFTAERMRSLLETIPDERVHEALDVLNADGSLRRVHGDIAALLTADEQSLRTWPEEDEFVVPPHDLLCAGFPCQPFSKSGHQRGFNDDTRGTVFHLIAKIIELREPSWVLLENVGNFERHDQGNTWKRVREILQSLKYNVRATLHVGADGGQGLLSPHHIGIPHHRERFFIVAQRESEPFERERYPFPLNHRQVQSTTSKRKLTLLECKAAKRLREIIGGHRAPKELATAAVAADRVECVVHWNRLLGKIRTYERTRASGAPSFHPMPSFPIWGFELDPWQHYPADTNPKLQTNDALREWRAPYLASLSEYGPAASHPPRGDRSFLSGALGDAELASWKALWPAYASERDAWPDWKSRFIRQSREWGRQLWTRLDPAWLRRWLDQLYTMTPSHQKLEWNAQGAELDLWKLILQFRPSGLRAKRFVHVPALVAMTTTQIPVVPTPRRNHPGAKHRRARGRHLLPSEALQLQGFPSTWQHPESRERAFQAFGNAVHAELISEIILTWMFMKDGPYDVRGQPLLAATSGATREQSVFDDQPLLPLDVRKDPGPGAQEPASAASSHGSRGTYIREGAVTASRTGWTAQQGG